MQVHLTIPRCACARQNTRDPITHSHRHISQPPPPSHQIVLPASLRKNNNKCFFSVLQDVVGNISKYRETDKLLNHLKSRSDLGRCPPTACSPWIRHCRKVDVGSKTVDSCRLSLTGPVVSVDKESKAKVR